jgi:hypothetical protein
LNSFLLVVLDTLFDISPLERDEKNWCDTMYSSKVLHLREVAFEYNMALKIRGFQEHNGGSLTILIKFVNSPKKGQKMVKKLRIALKI